MAKLKDLTGLKFNYLTVIKFEFMRKGQSYYLCKCDCGNKKVIARTSIVSGGAKSCGCLKRSDKSESRLYKIWEGMKARCKYKNRAGSKYYVLKNIKVCNEWTKYEVFKKWSLDHGYSDNLSIDRIDNNKGYSPDNCRWVDSVVQNNNKSNNIVITINGENHTMTEWCRMYKINPSTMCGRVHLGWEGKKLLIKGIKGRNQYLRIR